METQHCPHCGTALPAGASPDALCPACLLELAAAPLGEVPEDSHTIESGSGADQPERDPAAHLTDSAQLGPYTISRLIGRGGMGEVYLADDARLDRQVALKVLPVEAARDASRRARFEREARSAARLSHPNICTIHEVGEADGRPFIAMEYVDGVSLKERLTGPALTVTEVLAIGIQIADALNEARQKQIAHRDLKPANIMLTARGRIKVLDFGLAKQLPDHGAESRVTTEGLTEAGLVLGTLAYMSPEQALGREVDHRSDIFSFGVVLYEMLTGRPPFDRQSSPELLNAIVNADAPPIARYNDDVPDPLTRIVRKMLEKDCERRYQSVHEVWNDLQQLQEESGSQRPQDSGSEATESERPTQPRLGLGVRTALGTTVAAAVIALAVFLSRSTSPEVVPGALEVDSVVALPTQVFASADLEYLTDAVPATLSSLLARVDGLETKLPPTSLQAAGLGGDPTRIAAAYGAALVITSSVTAADERLVLDLQLVDPASRRVVWSDDFEGGLESYLELVRAAFDGVRVALRPESSPTGSDGLRTGRSDAELTFQRAKYYANRYNSLHQPADFDAAFDAYARTLALDPSMADAASGTGWLFVYRLEAGNVTPEETAPEVAAWANRALDIDAKSGEALGLLAALEEIHANPSWRKAREYVLRAVTLDPRSALAHFGLGRLTRSCTLGARATQEARAREPLWNQLYARNQEAHNLLCLDRPAEAVEVMNDALRIEPDFAYGLEHRTVGLIELDDLAGASATFERLRRLEFPQDALLATEMSLGLARGDSSAAEWVGRLRAYATDPTTPAYMLRDTEHVLPVLARHGEVELALQLIEGAVAAEVLPYDFLMLNPHLEPLRSDPRFQEAVREAERQWEEVLATFDDAQTRGELPAYFEEALSELQQRLDRASAP